MKKLVKIALSTALLSTSLFAGKTYVGVGGYIVSGTTTYDWKSYGYGTYDADYDSASGLSVKLGFILRNQNRFELSLNSFSIDYEVGDDTYTGIEGNYYWTFLNNNMVSPYIGLGIGYYGSDSKDGYNISSGEKENAHAVDFIGSAGVLLSLGKMFEIEVAYQYRYFVWNYADIDVTDKMNSLYGGLNFKF